MQNKLFHGWAFNSSMKYAVLLAGNSSVNKGGFQLESMKKQGLGGLTSAQTDLTESCRGIYLTETMTYYQSKGESLTF